MTEPADDIRERTRLGRDVVRRLRLPGQPLGVPRPARIGSIASSAVRFAAATSRPIAFRRALSGPEVRHIRSYRDAAVLPPRWWLPPAEPTTGGRSWRGRRDGAHHGARHVKTQELPARGLPKAVRRTPNEQSWTPGGIVESLGATVAQVRRFEAVSAAGAMLTQQERAAIEASVTRNRRAAETPPNQRSYSRGTPAYSSVPSASATPRTARRSSAALGDAGLSASAPRSPAPSTSTGRSPSPGFGGTPPRDSAAPQPPAGRSPAARPADTRPGATADADRYAPVEKSRARRSATGGLEASWLPRRVSRFAHAVQRHEQPFTITSPTAATIHGSAATLDATTALPAAPALAIAPAPPTAPALATATTERAPGGGLLRVTDSAMRTAAYGEIPRGTQAAGSPSIAPLRRAVGTAHSLQPRMSVGRATTRIVALPGTTQPAPGGTYPARSAPVGRLRNATAAADPGRDNPPAIARSGGAPTSPSSSAPNAAAAPLTGTSPTMGVRPTPEASLEQPAALEGIRRSPTTSATARGTSAPAPGTSGPAPGTSGPAPGRSGPATSAPLGSADADSAAHPHTSAHGAGGRSIAASGIAMTAMRRLPSGHRADVSLRPATATSELPVTGWPPAAAASATHVGREPAGYGRGSAAVRLDSRAEARGARLRRSPADTPHRSRPADPRERPAALLRDTPLLSSATAADGTSRTLARAAEIAMPEYQAVLRRAQRGAAPRRGTALASGFADVEVIVPAGSAQLPAPIREAPQPGSWRQVSRSPVRGTPAAGSPGRVDSFTPAPGWTRFVDGPAVPGPRPSGVRSGAAGRARSVERPEAGAGRSGEPPQATLATYLPAPPPISIRRKVAPPATVAPRSAPAAVAAVGSTFAHDSLVQRTRRLFEDAAALDLTHRTNTPMTGPEGRRMSDDASPTFRSSRAAVTSEPALTPDALLEDRRWFDDLVDKVVDRIEGHVVDELERRGRRHGQGAF
jgi:hypothetical protein